MLTLRGVAVSGPSGPIVRDVSLDVKAGEIVALIGPNGAGKTTLLEAVAGLRLREGIVSWEGRELDTFAATAKTVGFMPDAAKLPEEVSVREVLSGAAAMAERLGVGPLLARSAGRLSQGETKRVWLAWALALGRSVTLLDEPFGAFDPVELERVIDVVQEHARAGGAVLASVHQTSTAERVADRVALVARGRLVAFGTIDELRTRSGAAGGLDAIFRALVADAPA